MRRSMRRSSASRAVRFRVLVAETGVDGGPARAAVLDDPRLELLEDVDHAAAAVARAGALKPDVVVLDERLSGGAIAAAVEIGARMPELPLLITHGPDGDGLVEALAAGACAYVPSAEADEYLADAIVEVARGDVVLSHDQVARV